MKPRNRNVTPQMENAVARAVNFEVSIADMARRSERRAWMVAVSAVVMSLILAGGYFYMLPLKQKVPYLVMADAYTGTATVARLREDFNNQFVTTSEAVNRSNVAHFVIARESYDIALMNLRDWTTVYTMSSLAVASGYTALHSKTNPDSPFRTLGNGRAIRIKILSIVLIGGTSDSPPKGATVRFQRTLYDKTSGATKPLDSKIGTLEFSYKPNLKMEEKYRIENPLGFQVTSYRVDNDYAAAPPLESDVLPAMQEFGSPAAANQSREAAIDENPADLTDPAVPVDGAAQDASGSATPVTQPATPVVPANGADIR